MPKKLRVAMVGVGDITFLHWPAYRNFKQAELVALCDLDENLLSRRSLEWGVQQTTTDYRDLLESKEIDLIEVNTPHHTHKKVVVAALAAGKNVSCQKPISTTIGDAEAMIAAAKKSSGRFRVLENFVYYPPYVKAKELLEAGEIGEVLTIRFKLGSSLIGSRWIPLRTNLWHMMESEKGMGWAVFDDGYHKLSLAIHFVGSIQSVKGFIDRSFAFVDEPAQLIWQYKGKTALGSFDITLSPNLYTKSAYFPADERVEIIGTKGMLHLSCCTARINDAPPLVLYKEGKRFLFDSLETDWQASFTAGIRDFPLALLQKREALLSGERALAVLKFAYACILAAKLGTEVQPDKVTDEWIEESLLKKQAEQ